VVTIRGEPLLTRRGEGIDLLEAGGAGWHLAFSSRSGGVSPHPFKSLNMGFAVGDTPGRVLQNRDRLCRALGLDVEALVVPHQVHGTAVTMVGTRERGRGATDPNTAIGASDGLLTQTPGVPLLVSFADCVPVFVVAQRACGGLSIALVHAGWRGMSDGIVTETARRLRRAGGSLRSAVVGPGICGRCFTVGPEVGERFSRTFPGSYRDGRVDLREIAAGQLGAAGLSAADIHVSRLCTSCDTRFFSHRRDGGLTGRQAAIAWIASEVSNSTRGA
jgi:polyphenol oxidase